LECKKLYYYPISDILLIIIDRILGETKLKYWIYPKVKEEIRKELKDKYPSIDEIDVGFDWFT
jgi:hypothetical protein